MILDQPSRKARWIMRDTSSGHYGKGQINSGWRRERVYSRCGHVVRSILWTIVLFSQRPATRKYCTRVNVHTWHTRQCRQWEYDSPNQIYILRAGHVLYVQFYRLGMFGVLPGWSFLTAICAAMRALRILKR